MSFMRVAPPHSPGTKVSFRRGYSARWQTIRARHGAFHSNSVRNVLRIATLHLQRATTSADQNHHTAIASPFCTLTTFSLSLDTLNISQSSGTSRRNLGWHFEGGTKEKDVPHEKAAQTVGRQSFEGREQHKHLSCVWKTQKVAFLVSVLR